MMSEQKKLKAKLAMMEKSLHYQENQTVIHKHRIKNKLYKHQLVIYSVITATLIPLFMWNWKHKKVVAKAVKIAIMPMVSQLKQGLISSLKKAF